MTSRIIPYLSAAALAVAASTAARAQDGAYVSLGAGIAKVQNTDVRYYDVGGTFGGTGTEDSAQTSVELKQAAEFRGAIGYDFGVVRADVEIAYARNQLHAVTIHSVNGQPVALDADDLGDVCDYLEVANCSASGNTLAFGGGSKLRTLSALANVWVDIPVGKVVTPYLGGGIGAAGFELDGEGTGKFAWQLGAGVAVKVNRAIAITLDYRHREVSGKDFPWDDISGFEVGRIRSNSFASGLRLRF
jgi:opacity protein-like surface antigen